MENLPAIDKHAEPCSLWNSTCPAKAGDAQFSEISSNKIEIRRSIRKLLEDKKLAIFPTEETATVETQAQSSQKDFVYTEHQKAFAKLIDVGYVSLTTLNSARSRRNARCVGRQNFEVVGDWTKEWVQDQKTSGESKIVRNLTGDLGYSGFFGITVPMLKHLHAKFGIIWNCVELITYGSRYSLFRSYILKVSNSRKPQGQISYGWWEDEIGIVDDHPILKVSVMVHGYDFRGDSYHVDFYWSTKLKIEALP
ncbi:hypothetical protein L218DRAFT_947657 [Marasmius fiardii PR-910]|nr:hypothetical protein L218DRAFT_947657 [Marasmius fiardii PR-910]